MNLSLRISGRIARLTAALRARDHDFFSLFRSLDLWRDTVMPAFDKLYSTSVRKFPVLHCGVDAGRKTSATHYAARRIGALSVAHIIAWSCSAANADLIQN